MNTIEEVITNAYVETERIIDSKKTESEEERVNRHLDTILEVSDDVKKLNAIYVKLNDDLELIISSHKDSTLLSRMQIISKPLITSSLKLYHSLYRSKLYPGMKTLVKEYYTNLEYFRELSRSASTKISLSNSERLSGSLKNVK